MTLSPGLETDRLIAVVVGSKSLAARTRTISSVRETRSWQFVLKSISHQELEAGRDVLKACQQLGIDVIPFLSPLYPLVLAEIPDPPAVLFVRSRAFAHVSKSFCVGVVGTRAASIEMCHRASELASDLVAGGVTVVSGLALGIDGAAHRGALQGNPACPTIAVLAHGLDELYPPSHRPLAEAIVTSGGALISEYPPGVGPLKHQFLARNRIIAGLSRGVVVVEAGARSGSLVTARFAADFGRDVFVMDGATSDERTAGGISLIEQGATRIARGGDVLLEYGLSHHPIKETGEMLELSLDDLSKQIGASISDILRLELSGLVRCVPGNRCVIGARILRELLDAQ